MFAGRIEAQSELDRGGAVEVSSLGKLAFIGEVDARGGRSPGRLLLDPQNLTVDDTTGVLAQFAFTDPNPNSTGFGQEVITLPGGNVAVSDSADDFGAPAAGAAYLFSSSTGALVSTLLGSTANDRVASQDVSDKGLISLNNGNFLVRSRHWDNGAASDAGEVTWVSGSAGLSGSVSPANSLVGSTTLDRVSEHGVTVLTNGSYVVRSANWDNGAISDAGAATWGSGTAGISGAVSAANSLVGTTAFDFVSFNGVTALTNGNYVVISLGWDGVATAVGAVTFGDGTTGTTGAVSAANSLVGTTASDQVGVGGVTPLTNGNYVVASRVWQSGGMSGVGAATWGSGTTGVSGPVSAANSLVGTNSGDQVSQGGITALANGNYVVKSWNWTNGAASFAGAATWGDGTVGISGPVSASNSLVGTSTGDNVAVSGVTALTNGNYVVCSRHWRNGAVSFVGAVTWGNGAAGITGPVTPGNSLIGSSNMDLVSSLGAVALPNGNYVVRSPRWNNGAATSAGAATWGNGATGTTGVVSVANSLVGTSASDNVSSDGIDALPSGNYVVRSGGWGNGGNTQAGAATWGNGTTGISGPVSPANSLVGQPTNSRVGRGGLVVLSNGNYVVQSPEWSGATGAVTWGSGTSGVVGVVSAANSLVGGSVNDRIGARLIALTNGNYVTASASWSDGAKTQVGSATWGNGTTGTTGVVSGANSLIGPTASDRVGLDGLTALTNGDYVVQSSVWDDGATTDAGALTLGSGASGSTGFVSRGNSLVGDGSGVPTLVVASLAQGFIGSFQGQSVSVAFPLEQATFATLSGQSLVVPASRIVEVLSSGTDVTLQASQDITISSPIVVDNPTGNGGTLTISAGRSVVINANISTDDGGLVVSANSPLAEGVVDADRGAGAASIRNLATIDAGAGSVRFETKDGAGLTHSERSDYNRGTITASAVTLVPFLTSISPTSATPSDTITIAGGGFEGATVTVGGVAAVASVSGGLVTLSLSPQTPNGPQAAVLTTSSGSLALGNLQVSGAGKSPSGGGSPLPGAGQRITKTGGKGCALDPQPGALAYPSALLFVFLLLGGSRRRTSRQAACPPD